MEQGLGAGRLAQLVEHRLYTPAVTGSNPVPPTSLNAVCRRCIAGPLLSV